MVHLKNLSTFEVPLAEPFAATVAPEPQGVYAKWVNKFQLFVLRKFGANSRLAEWALKIPRVFPTLQKTMTRDSTDQLTQIKSNRFLEERLNLGLTFLLLVMVLFSWKTLPLILNKIDQFNNDLVEQKQVIETEKKNNAILNSIEENEEGLTTKRETVLDAIPFKDEKAEQILATLEAIASDLPEPINSISIREVPETQIGYDDLNGTVNVYEYAFTVEADYAPILNLIREIRRSPRVMDIMAFEIQENKGLYRASFSLYAYNLIKS